MKQHHDMYDAFVFKFEVLDLDSPDLLVKIISLNYLLVHCL